ncbi:MAG TPA: class I SAM-dependent methyltransferase [Bryobacteraceae bacterium]|nr:class I SAM-dependent methyltransferase [Bryobacteraceae bacterium]
MDRQEHWEHVYGTKAPHQVSWYRPHLEISLSLIERAAPGRSARIIDVGGGASTLVDDLIARGYRDVTVLDISRKAIDVARARLGAAADSVAWIAGDALTVALPSHFYDVWHDRAVFHFLTNPADRAAYVRRVRESVKRGGHVIIGTFGPEGPEKCSGLDVKRYDAETLHGEFGPSFTLVDRLQEVHQTPFGATQQFVYCFCAVD